MCVFCELEPGQIKLENDLACCIYDGYPVTHLHSLIIPKRHVETYFDLTGAEREACHNLVAEMKEYIQREDGYVDGFNIGINNGQSAGQTVFHCHIHLIPRRMGDVEDPRGGVRGVIPDRQQY